MNDHPFALQILPSASGSAASVATSSTGSKLTYFVLLDVDKGKGFYFYNPVSAKFLARDPTPGSSDVGVIAENYAALLGAKQQDRFIWYLFLDEEVPITRKPVLL